MHIPPRTRRLLGFNLTGDLGPFTIYNSRKQGQVWFIKAPPTKPPTFYQTRCRNRFRHAARSWRALTQEVRDDWNTACRRLNLLVHGYNLWLYWQIMRDRRTIATIEQQSGISLLSP